MTELIAVTGKGGTGKTTLATLIIKYLVDQGLRPILAVDADSNSNLDIALGVELDSTIGAVREEMTEKVQRQQLPAGMPKQDLLEMQIEQSLVETKDFDLLSMGRGEGPGCYCAINNMLRVFLERLSGHYRFVVIDNEAGMEHLSRRTTRKVDLMFVVSDPSRRGLETATRIEKLARDMEIEIGRILLVIARMRGPLEGPMADAAEGVEMELAGVIPDDPEVNRLDAEGLPLFELPEGSAATVAVREIMESVLQGVS